MGKSKRVISNLIITTFSQIIILATGLILPRIVLVFWGSEYNGFISSVTTIMQYLSLLEAGISVSTIQALYKSIGSGDDEQTSIVVNSSQYYYKKVSVVYAVAVLAIAFIYPIFLDSSIPYWEMFFVIFLQGLCGVINFAFRAALQQLLNAEGQYYVVALVNLLTNILTCCAKIISIMIFNSLIIMQVFGVIIMIVQVLIYGLYFKKKFHWINRDAGIDMSLLENRKYYIIQQIAGLVFHSTDTFLLSVFCGLKVASVYTVYNLVYGALVTLIGIVRNSTNFVLGQTYHESKEKFTKIYKTYTSFQMSFGGVLASCSILLIIGFITIYTSDINDINYINYFAAILFSLNLMLDCSRGACLVGTNVAGMAPQTTWRYIVEALINIFVSLALVKNLGINGVLLGTFISGVWRSVDSIVYFYKHVLSEKPIKEFLYIILNFSIFLIIAYFGKIFPIHISSLLSFIKWGLIVSVVSVMIYGFIFYIYNRCVLIEIINNRILKKR